MYQQYHCSEVLNGNHGLVQVSVQGCMCKFCPRSFSHLHLNYVNARNFQEQNTNYLQISFIRIQIFKYPSITLNIICHYSYQREYTNYLQIFCTSNCQKLLVHSQLLSQFLGLSLLLENKQLFPISGQQGSSTALCQPTFGSAADFDVIVSGISQQQVMNKRGECSPMLGTTYIIQNWKILADQNCLLVLTSL